MSVILVRAKIATEIKTLSAREQRPDSAISQLAILPVRVLWYLLQAEMLMCSRIPISAVLCSWNVATCVGKNLGIASAGATGLKALVHVLQATMQACSFWDFAIPFGRNGSKVLNGLLLAAKTQLLR